MQYVVQCTLNKKEKEESSVMYSVASKTKSQGLKEYQSYVAHIHSILKTKK